MCGPTRRGKRVPPEHVRPDSPGTVRPQRSGELMPAQRTASWPSSQTPWASPAGRFLEGQPSALFTLLHGHISHSEKGIFFLFQQRLDFISLSKFLCTYCSISSRILPVFTFIVSLSLSPLFLRVISLDLTLLSVC